MLGAIIGDIVGSPYEFANTTDPSFPLFSKESEFTDDSVCTIAVADALVRDVPMALSLREWCHFYPNPKGAYGGSFSAWLASPNPAPYNSWGNGAAMRVSACGWAAKTEAEAMRLGLESALPTHNHPEGLIGASVVARGIFLLRTFGWTAEGWRRVVDMLESAYGSRWADNCPEPGQWDETCQGCVPLAFSLLGECRSYEQAVREAVLYGGDSDTLAAIVGSLAEAAWSIPAEIRDKALGMLPKPFLAVIDKFSKKFDYVY